jgi:hypothetical protein
MDCNHERNEGERRKQDVLQTLAAHREAYVNRGRRVLLERLLSHGLATADDVRRAVELPGKIDPRCLGSVPGPLARAGIIRCTGSTKTKRAKAHARKIEVWALADRAAALAWLAAHPDQPDQGPDTLGSPVVNPTNPNNGTGSAVAQPSLF